jgi:hypothetical protein
VSIRLSSRFAQEPFTSAKSQATSDCCRALDWRKAEFGYEEPAAVILPEATTFCTMCVEEIQGLRDCPAPADARSMTGPALTMRPSTG